MSGVTTHVVGAVASIAIGFGAVLPATQRTPPVDILDMYAVTRTVEQGRDLLIHVGVHRRELCLTTAYVTLYDGANIEWTIRPDERAAFGDIGTETRIVRHQIPQGATPGQARYRLVLSWRCNWTHDIAPVIRVYPDVPFIIEEAA